MSLPEKGEKLRIVGDVSKVNENAQGAKGTEAAGGRDGAHVAVATGHVAVARVVWIGTRSPQVSAKWANRYELTLAKDFVRAIWTRLPEGETGRLLFQVEGKDAASEPIAPRGEQGAGGQDGAGTAGRRWERSRLDRRDRRWRVGFA